MAKQRTPIEGLTPEQCRCELTTRTYRADLSTLDLKGRSIEACIATEDRVKVIDWDRWEVCEEILRMDGLKLPTGDQVPLLDTHNRMTVQSQLGSTRHFRVEGGKLLARNFYSSSPEAEHAWTLCREGHLTDNSVGYRVHNHVMIDAGKTAAVGGREYTASATMRLRIALSWEIRENSVCPIGADPSAKNRNEPINKNQTITPGDSPMPATIKELRQAATEYDGLLERDTVDTLIVRTLEAESDIDSFRQEVLKAVKLEKLRAAGKNNVTSSPEVPIQGSNRKEIEQMSQAGVLIAAGRADAAEKAFGAEICNRAEDLGFVGFHGIARAALTLENKRIPHAPGEMVREAISTVLMPTLLGGSLDKIIAFEYQQAKPTWMALAKVHNPTNFREYSMLKPDINIELQALGDGGELKLSDLGEESFDGLRVDTYGLVVKLGRQAVVNDDLGVFLSIPAELSKGALRKQSDLFWAVWLANTNHFKNANGNLPGAGSGQALSVATLGTAIMTLRKMTDKRGYPISVEPKCLVIPPDLETTARMILNSIEIQRDQSADLQETASPFSGLNLELVVEPRLSNAKFTGYSTTTWYLSGGPMDAPLNVGFLNGNRSPKVEVFGLDKDPNCLSYSWRCYADFGAALGNPKAAVKMIS